MTEGQVFIEFMNGGIEVQLRQILKHSNDGIIAICRRESSIRDWNTEKNASGPWASSGNTISDGKCARRTDANSGQLLGQRLSALFETSWYVLSGILTLHKSHHTKNTVNICMMQFTALLIGDVINISSLGGLCCDLFTLFH